MSLVAKLIRRSAMRNAFALSGLFIIVLALCGIWMVAQIRTEVREEIDTQLRLTHAELLGASADDVRAWSQNQDDFLFFSESFRTVNGQIIGTVRDTVFDRSGFQTLTTQELFQPRFLSDFQSLSDELVAEELPLDFETWRVFVGPFMGGEVALFEPISGVEDALGLIPRVVLTVGTALVLTTLLSGVLLAWRQQARLDRVRDGIARIGRGDLSHPMAPAHVRDDLDEIMVGIDRAAQDLDGSISRLRLFSQNVAHELRTPLARLRATLEQSPHTPDAALERTDEVIRTLDAVHRIARLSHKPDPGTLAPVNLKDVVSLAEELFAEVAADNGQRISVVLDTPQTVQGDFQLLVQMLSNLVENAIRYGGANAEITISACGSRLSVQDTGPGIVSPEDMTEPFARAAEVRALDGTGLGLALVKSIARYHDAELTLTSDNGLLAQVTFGQP